jgi:cysteine desulfurase / selenocysteine lyase
MTTSDRDAAAAAAQLTGVEVDVVDAFESMSTALGSLPDASVLAQMANEMFKAIPGFSAAASQAGASPPPLPFGGLPVGLDRLDMPMSGFPGEADLRALAGLASGGIAAPPAVPPAIPGSMPATMGGQSFLPAAPSFYFLEDTQAFARAATEGSKSIESFEVRPEVVPAVRETGGLFDPSSIRRDFPILGERVNGKSLVWLDNAATTQKPRAVIDRISRFYERENSNIHRAAHALAARSTDAYEAARETSRRFLNASSTREIVFVRGATEGINLVAQSFGRRFVGEGDEIVLTRLEHHSNIVPWQLLCAEKGARLRVAPVDDTGQILLEEYERLFSPRTRLVSLTHVSNALGTITPVREMIAIAHRHGARVLVDGAQAVSHLGVDVQALDCDFYVFSGHKVFGPTGIGVVYGKEDLLNTMPPWQGGGNMIADVTFEKTVYNPAPMRFEAGTGNIADAVGLGAALEYLMGVGIENVTRHEHDLLVYATKALLDIPGLRLIGTAREKAGVLSFVLDGFRSEDVGKALDSEGIAVRSGHHCAQPALRRFGVESSVRPSLALYNTCEDIDALIAALRRLQSGRGLRSG